MAAYETKLSKLTCLMAAGDYRAALKLASGWGKRGLGGGKEADAILAGWEATVRPEWQEALGRDPAALVAAGIAAIRARYKLPLAADETRRAQSSAIEQGV